MADKKNWLQLLAYVTGSINQELLLRNEYLAAENHILKSQIKGRLRLSDGERATLAGIAKRLGRKALQEVACIAKPDTILAWYRKLVAQKFDGSKKRGLAGRPRVDAAIEELVVKLARENSGWGYDRIVGALANLGHKISDQSVGNILRRQGIAPPRSANKVQPGATSLGRTWMCWQARTSLRWKCSRGGAWRRIMCCSSFIWATGGYRSPESRIIPTLWRWSRWPETRLWRNWGACTPAEIFCMIATPSSANRSERC